MKWRDSTGRGVLSIEEQAECLSPRKEEGKLSAGLLRWAHKETLNVFKETANILKKH